MAVYSKSDKKAYKKAEIKIRHVLFKEWNPIGISVSDMTEWECGDEYDNYIPQIYSRLKKRDADALCQYLVEVETKFMELEADKDIIKTVVDSLMKLNIQ